MPKSIAEAHAAGHHADYPRPRCPSCNPRGVTPPSDVQLDALRRLVAAKQPIVRRAGGFWCVADSAEDVLVPRSWQKGEWSVGIPTVRAMERRGYLARVGRAGTVADVFDDPRVVTDLGRQVVERATRGA